MPVTDATAAFGNTSDVVVYRFADHPWCAAVARLTSAIVSTGPFASTHIAATGIQKAQMAIANLRARPISHPRRISAPDIQPPATLPTLAAVYTTGSAQPISFRLKLRTSYRYGGSQYK